ncbi:MAG: type III pantothenate kinase [Bacteroidales bacterium]
MNLIIDQGNSSCKVALFDGEVIIESIKYKYLLVDDLINLCSRYRIDKAIISSVKAVDDSIIDFLQRTIPVFLQLNHTTPIPIRLGYKTPNTLGCDRIAAVVAAFFQFPGRDVLVIDAGTAITFDLLDSTGLFRGGNISPGLEMRLESLHIMTNKLPLVGRLGDTPSMGYDTETAIRSGVIKGISYEIDGYVNSLKNEMPDLLVFLTGGSCKYFEDHIKSTIFADNNIVLKGLNCIIEYNAKL